MTISKAHALIVLAAAAALPLAACADPTSTSSSTSGSDSTSAAATTASYDVSKIPTVDEIAALVPDEVKERGTLRNGASADYAPAEFLGDDSQTPQGYDVDINKALTKVMGLKEGTTNHAEFPTIIPALGTKFDVGISSFTITSEREEQANLISYVEVGSAYGVAAGNPKNFDPTDPCGKTIGVQTGTAQEDYATELSEKCVADGKDKITIMPLHRLSVGRQDRAGRRRRRVRPPGGGHQQERRAADAGRPEGDAVPDGQRLPEGHSGNVRRTERRTDHRRAEPGDGRLRISWQPSKTALS